MTAIRDLLPIEVDAPASALPSEILEFQAQRLEQRTKGVLKGRILRSASESEVVLSFELAAPALDYTAILFKVRHRPDFEFPALIVPPEPLPDFLRPTITVTKVRKGAFGTAASMVTNPFDRVDEVTEKNPWLTVTSEEFENKIGEVLQLPQIRSTFASLLSKSDRATSANQSCAT